MKIIENVLPVEEADWLENMCLTQGQWLFLPDSSHKDVKDRKLWPSMSLPVFCVESDRPVQNKQWLDQMDVLVHTFAIASKCNPSKLRRIRFGMYFPIDPGVSHEPHIDTSYKHIVMLYYVNDSDGDTYFYEKGIVKDKVSPKKNTAVVFDGNTYHASSNPSKDVRITLNLNFGV